MKSEYRPPTTKVINFLIKESELSHWHTTEAISRELGLPLQLVNGICLLNCHNLLIVESASGEESPLVKMRQ